MACSARKEKLLLENDKHTMPANERATDRHTQKKHHRISHLPNQLEMIHLVIIVRESQPVSPNFNHSKQSRISTIASLFLLLLIRHPLFSASYWQVYQLPSNVELSSGSAASIPSIYSYFPLANALRGIRSGPIWYKNFAVLLNLLVQIAPTDRQTDTMTGDSNNWRKLGGVEGETTWMNEKRVKSQWNFLIPFTPDYADIMKRSERLNYTTGMAGWPKKRHVYYVWFIRSKPTNARGIIFCDDISPPQQRSCRSFAIIVLVVPLFLKLVNHHRNSPYLEKQQSPNMGSRRFLD